MFLLGDFIGFLRSSFLFNRQRFCCTLTCEAQVASWAQKATRRGRKVPESLKKPPQN